MAHQFDRQEAAPVAILIMLIAGERPTERFGDRTHRHARSLAQLPQPTGRFRNFGHCTTILLKVPKSYHRCLALTSGCVMHIMCVNRDGGSGMAVGTAMGDGAHETCRGASKF